MEMPDNLTVQRLATLESSATTAFRRFLQYLVLDEQTQVATLAIHDRFKL